jgi:hypothetical protein
MIVASNAFDRLIASLRIFGTLVVGAVLIAGMTTALSGPRSAGCGSNAGKAAGLSAVVTQHQGP